MYRFSATEYSTYNTGCHRAWYFEWRLGIPRKRTAPMKFGSVFHEFCELYHKGAELVDFWGEFEVTSYPEREKHLLKSMMENYVKFDSLMLTDSYNETRVIPRPSDAEFLFEYKFEDAETFFDRGICLVGKIDMCFLRDGILTIVDHKTSDDPWSIPQFNLNSQAEFYHVMVNNAFKNMKQIGEVESVEFLWNICLKKVGSRSQIRDLFQRERVIYTSVRDNLRCIETVIDQMQRYNNLPPKRSGPGCIRCDYLALCLLGNNEEQVLNYLSSEKEEK